MLPAGSSEAQIVDRAMEITKFGDHLGEGGILGHAGDWPQDDDEEDEFSDDESDENWAPDGWNRNGGGDACGRMAPPASRASLLGFART